ncbi:unnamed protein product [Hymenolepis diminuta]|uniref:MFS domain-containing protein n=1 Tax=Hymenolepis diminuta TaxID=6216 RepID=A0A564YHS7_HYMDI|nr:unnamed protein product [Hymenolepis diminuta]
MSSHQRSPNGIFVLLGGILNFTGLGYYYTVDSLIPTIKIYLMKHNFGENSINANWFPTLILLTSAVVMPLAGIMERRTIFKVPLLLSALFCSLGILLSHLSVKSGYAFFTLTYCVMYGIGFGLNYSITPSVVLEAKKYINGEIINGEEKIKKNN